ncbi:arylsulfatase [Wenyingzhuangia sp. IMCC45574]
MRKAIVIAILFALNSLSTRAQKLKNTKPSILLIMTDDQGQHLSYTGHPYLETPNIDAFAKKSTRFTDFHVSPTCSPTRSAIMSGRHEFRNGVTGTVRERELLDIEATLFPELLKKAGYRTGIFGKWHLGDIKEYRPMQRGFTESLIHGAGGIGQFYPGSCADFPENKEKDKLRYFNNVLLHNEEVVRTKGYCTDVFFDAAWSFMKKNIEQKKPFFTYLATNTPHAPNFAKQENIDRIKERYPNLKQKLKKYPKIKVESIVNYFAMIENIDDNFGKLMKRLTDAGALDNTLIIFTTDNGVTKKNGGSDIFNAGFKTGKGSPQEGGGHVPCFWFWKGKLQENVDVKALTAHIDLYKTFCELTGTKIPNNIQELEGRSLVPLLQNPKAEWEDRILYHTVGRWKPGVAPVRDARWGVRTQKWRLVTGNKLFDIENDPKEDHNVISEHPEVAKKLLKQYHLWWEQTLPFLINENRTWKGDAPYVKLYKEAKKKGIPYWNPLN